MAAGSSPRKLQRSIWNQIAPSSPPSASGSGSSTSAGPDDVTLSLRKLSLSPPAFPSSPSPSSPHSRVLSAVLTQAQPRSKAITTLDLSYSILDPHSLAKLCSLCSRVRCLIAVECGLSDTLPDTQWPRRLCKINLSRNNFHRIPQGFENLLYLRELNLSGNQVDHVAPAVLQLPLLERLHLLRNPVRNIPKAVCLSGVQHMRDFLQVQPLPPPSPEDSDDVPSAVRRLSLEDGRNLRRTLLKRRLESLESGYDSGTRMLSTTSSCSSDSEAEKDTPEEPLPIQTWPKFAPSFLPQGYTEVSGSHTVLCQVYLPPGSTSGSVLVEEVKDLSLHPQLASNELLVTPVVRVSPHGLKFRADQPAIVVLPHCTRPSGGTAEEVVVLCSNTGPCELPQWRRVCEGMCDMFESSVKFSTTHFSLFAVISTMPYHSAELVISSNEGGSLTLPECPGFQVKFPAGSLMTERGEETITATIYYADSPLNGASSDPRGASPDPHGASPDPHGASPNQEEEVEGLALASPVVGLEPHGIHFSQPVEVTLPVPDYAAIKSALPEASLQLWTASHEALSWSRLVETQLSVDLCRDGQHTVSFSVPHFTFFELLWDTCRDTLMRLGYGAAVVYRSLRARYVAVRCQVFMTPPQLDLTFALLVVVYKFGERLSELGNYPWMLADSGDRQVFLRTGELEAALNGCFEPRTEYGETSLSQSQTLGFTGQDFSLRFAFSLKLSSLHSLLADYQVIGKLQLRQGSGGTAMQLNLIKVPVLLPTHARECMRRHLLHCLLCVSFDYLPLYCSLQALLWVSLSPLPHQPTPHSRWHTTVRLYSITIPVSVSDKFSHYHFDSLSIHYS